MTVMVTRRALRRTMLLRPDRELNNLFLYCLAVLSTRLAIDVHHFVVMSNHYHLILTDTRGNFLRELNRILALGIKVLRKWDGAAWDHEKPAVVELRTEQAVIEEIAYAAGNPTAAFAVRRAAQWPGLVVLPQHLGRMSWTARRPDFYFDQDSPQWPDTATLQLSMPPLTLTDATVRDAVSQELERIEKEAHDALLAKGAHVLGPQKVLAMSPYDRATSWEALRSRNPAFAVGRGQRDAFFEAVRVLREFRKTYRAALTAWRAGIRDALFPAGTWFMRWAHSATVAPT
jgi:hypothetical protein